MHLFNSAFVPRNEKFKAFKIIHREFPEWWGSESTQDLRDDLKLAIDSLSVRIKWLSVANSMDDMYDLSKSYRAGGFAQFAVDGTAILAGDSASRYMSKILNLNGDISGLVGVGVSHSTSAVLQNDCFCFRWENEL